MAAVATWAAVDREPLRGRLPLEFAWILFSCLPCEAALKARLLMVSREWGRGLGRARDSVRA